MRRENEQMLLYRLMHGQWHMKKNAITTYYWGNPNQDNSQISLYIARIVQIKNSRNNVCWLGCGNKSDSQIIAVGMLSGLILMENHMKNNSDFLVSIPRTEKTFIQKNLCRLLFIAIFRIRTKI